VVGVVALHRAAELAARQILGSVGTVGSLWVLNYREGRPFE
jgi:hypothetical protein